MRGILLVSHCILNPYTAVSGSTPNREAMRVLMDWALESDVALSQMPCPEFTHAGASRPPQVREAYETPEFRAHCSRLVAGVIAVLGEHLAAGHPVLGIVGIEGSPSCGVELTTRASDSDGVKVTGEGIFTEGLRAALDAKSWAVPYVGLPHWRQQEAASSWRRRLIGLLAPDGC